MKWATSVISVGSVLMLAWLLSRRATSPSSAPWTLPSGWQDLIEPPQTDSTPDNTSLPSSDESALISPSWSGLQGWSQPSEPSQTPSILESIFVTINPSTYTPAAVPPDVAERNVRACLDMIAWAEGANYDTLYGGGTFASYADHPRQYLTFKIGGREVTSSAAGRYQFLARTWDGLRAKLGLQDFSPANQDLGAIELIRERGALNDVRAGRMAAALPKIAKVWASLPGAGYNQPEKKLTSLLAVYAASGGTTEVTTA